MLPHVACKMGGPAGRSFPMKPAPAQAVIVGGGIAGLAAAITLGRKGWVCTVLEQDAKRLRSGQGLLLPPSGRDALKRLGLKNIEAFTAPIHGYQLCNADGTLLKQFGIDGALSVLHRDLLTSLQGLLPKTTRLVEGRCRAVEADGNGLWSAMDESGRHWQATLLVAADGVRSRSRRHLFPEAQLTAERTSEVVLVTRAPAVVEQLRGQCRKFQDRRAGLGLGLLPCRDGQVVVFAQFTTGRCQPCGGAGATPLLRECFSGWNDLLDALLADLDASHAHLWHTTDLDPLPQLHRGNLVLVGDSAHPLLTFTSQGSATALDDALVLAELVAEVPANDQTALTKALERYSRTRLAVVTQLVAEGRRKQRQFLQEADVCFAAGAPLVGFGLEPSPAR
jgi:2-polyprenyl-6-methoxyphenol hydroxylase-like FAD-dependent oxidoreductase